MNAEELDIEIPEDESPAQTLRVLDCWLADDSDLPDAEVTQFRAALAAGIEALERAEHAL